MKKFFLMLQLAALSAGSSAFALTGGPFENSDAGILQERGGFYQSAFSYRNGNGYAIWTPDAPWYADGSSGADFRRTTLITPATSRSFTDHSANRSVFYYKGVTYVGGAWGELDLDAREIQGVCNAVSEFGVTSTTQTTSANIVSFSQSIGTTSATVVENNRGYVANLGWTGKIYDRSPILRFRGKGELFILSQNGTEALASLAYTAYSGLISAIIANVAQSGGQNQDGTIFFFAQNAIDTLLDDLAPKIENTGPSRNYSEGERVRVRVKGLRRFF